MPVAIGKVVLDQFISYGDAVLSALRGYGVPDEKTGVACARGTLVARLNSLRVIATALETRDPTAKDDFELAGMASTVKWLQSDTYVTKDFGGVELTILDTPFTEAYPNIGITGETDFTSAMTSLVRSLDEVLRP
jgi:hypothetical protein